MWASYGQPGKPKAQDLKQDTAVGGQVLAEPAGVMDLAGRDPNR